MCQNCSENGVSNPVNFALLLSLMKAYGIPDLSAERDYAWRELRKWALNPTELPADQKLGLKYVLPSSALPFCGVVARVLTKNVVFLVMCGVGLWVVSIVLMRKYIRLRGVPAIEEEYGFGMRGVHIFHTLLFFGYYLVYVFMTAVLISIR